VRLILRLSAERINLQKRGKNDKGNIVLIHGLGEHSGRYHAVIQSLVESGYRVITFDLPGHGKSPGRRGHFSFKQIFHLLDEMIVPGERSFLMGHSLGGLIAARYAQCKSSTLRGLVLSSPAVCIGNANMVLEMVAHLLGIALPFVAFKNGINPDDLSRNKSAVENYINDPLVHDKISAKLASDMFWHSRKALKEASKINCPTLLLVGSEDRITPTEGSHRFFKHVSSSDKEFKVYQGAYHEIFEDPQHSSTLLSDMITWLEKH